jgi:hypothetical protein
MSNNNKQKKPLRFDPETIAHAVRAFPLAPLFAGEIRAEDLLEIPDSQLMKAMSQEQLALVRMGKQDEFNIFQDELKRFRKNPTPQNMRAMFEKFQYRKFEPIGDPVYRKIEQGMILSRRLFKHPFIFNPAFDVAYTGFRDGTIGVSYGMCYTDGKDSTFLVFDPDAPVPTFFNDFFDCERLMAFIDPWPDRECRFREGQLISGREANARFLSERFYTYDKTTEAIVKLFMEEAQADPKQEWARRFLTTMKAAYADPNNPFFDLKKSDYFRSYLSDTDDVDSIRMLALGLDLGMKWRRGLFNHVDLDKPELASASDAFDTGIEWRDGEFERVDLEKAKKWFLISLKKGHAAAGAALFDILNKDERYKNGDLKFRAAANAIFERARKIGSDRVQFLDAMYELSGIWGQKNSTRGIGLLEKLADTPNQQSSDAIYQLAVRNYFGLDVPRDLKKADMYLKRFLDGRTSDDADGLKMLIQNELNPETIEAFKNPIIIDAKKIEEEKGAQATSDSKPFPQPKAQTAKSIAEAARFISAIYKGQLGFDHAMQIIDTGKIEATPTLNGQFKAALTVLHPSWGGNYPSSYKKLRELYREVQMKLLGVTREEVRISTQRFGPRYNKFGANGYLVPTSFDPNSIPKKGATYFRGLHAKKAGEIDFYFENDPAVPPMIFSQDIDVALVLAFHPSKPALPSLGLEGLDDSFFDRRPWIFRQKAWKPEWIGHTMFGETLYAADYWMGELIWHSRCFPATPEDIPDRMKRAHVKTLLKEVEEYNAAHAGCTRIMLKPRNVYATWNTSGGDVVCDVHRMDIATDGSNVGVEMDYSTQKYVENRSLNLNDPHYQIGRAARYVTARYNEIAEIFPLFERSRQIVGLMNTLIALRDDHKFQPGEALAKRIDQAYQFYTKKPPIALRQRLCLPLFGEFTL